MDKLTDKELFSAKRLDHESESQYKNRRRTIYLARRYYTKSKISNEGVRVRDYVDVIISTLKVDY